MSQFRKDPFSSAWVMISPERGLEASEFGSVEVIKGPSLFSPGFEHHLGEELYAIRTKHAGFEDWQIRVIRHPHAVLSDKELTLQQEKLFSSASNSGYQEIIIEHPRSDMSLELMPKAHLVQLLQVYRQRLAHLSQQRHIKHVQLSRSVGRVAGNYFAHPHAQVVALPFENRWLEEEKQASSVYHQQSGTCLYCELINKELELRERIVSSHENFVALSPYAAKMPFETWILPRRHDSAFSSLLDSQLHGLAMILVDVLEAMNRTLSHPPYHLLLHTLPCTGDSSYHWHIEILPRLRAEAGFDMGSGLYINPTPPEEAARFLRQTLAMREVSF
ncbi:MAG: hypothetical protein R2880_06925 [Deinococcales bacterium]